MNKNISIVIVVILLLIVGAASFYGGTRYQASKSFGSGQFAGGNRQGIGGMRNGQGQNGNGRPILGEIVSIDQKSLTVKLTDGSSKIVIMPDNVSISKTADGSKDDLKVGVRVGVFGTGNPDGSTTAQNIQLNPTFRLGGQTQGTQR